jgi:hypothetical protein
MISFSLAFVYLFIFYISWSNILFFLSNDSIFMFNNAVFSPSSYFFLNFFFNPYNFYSYYSYIFFNFPSYYFLTWLKSFSDSFLWRFTTLLIYFFTFWISSLFSWSSAVFDFNSFWYSSDTSNVFFYLFSISLTFPFNSIHYLFLDSICCSNSPIFVLIIGSSCCNLFCIILWESTKKLYFSDKSLSSLLSRLI